MPETQEQSLSSDQISRAIELMRAYLAAPANPDGRTPVQMETEMDQERVRVIESEFQPLLRQYITGQTTLADFKSRVDGINKRNRFWGFKGIKGQMFFNMIVNAASDADECDKEIKEAIVVPASEEAASIRIKKFADYVKRIGDRLLESAGGETASSPFWVSYSAGSELLVGRQ